MIPVSRAPEQTGAALPNPGWGPRGTALLPAALSDTGSRPGQGMHHSQHGQVAPSLLHPCSWVVSARSGGPESGYRDGNGAADGREQAEVEALSC